MAWNLSYGFLRRDGTRLTLIDRVSTYSLGAKSILFDFEKSTL